jgi:hypothetical protein
MHGAKHRVNSGSAQLGESLTKYDPGAEGGPMRLN